MRATKRRKEEKEPKEKSISIRSRSFLRRLVRHRSGEAPVRRVRLSDERAKKRTQLKETRPSLTDVLRTRYCTYTRASICLCNAVIFGGQRKSETLNTRHRGKDKKKHVGTRDEFLGIYLGGTSEKVKGNDSNPLVSFFLFLFFFYFVFFFLFTLSHSSREKIHAEKPSSQAGRSAK